MVVAVASHPQLMAQKSVHALLQTLQDALPLFLKLESPLIMVAGGAKCSAKIMHVSWFTCSFCTYVAKALPAL